MGFKTKRRKIVDIFQNNPTTRDELKTNLKGNDVELIVNYDSDDQRRTKSIAFLTDDLAVHVYRSDFIVNFIPDEGRGNQEFNITVRSEAEIVITYNCLFEVNKLCRKWRPLRKNYPVILYEKSSILLTFALAFLAILVVTTILYRKSIDKTMRKLSQKKFPSSQDPPSSQNPPSSEKAPS